MSRSLRILAAAASLLVYQGVSALAVNIPTVPVGNPGNAADTPHFMYGSVANEYRIGVTELTNVQYIEFLNAR